MFRMGENSYTRNIRKKAKSFSISNEYWKVAWLSFVLRCKAFAPGSLSQKYIGKYGDSLPWGKYGDSLPQEKNTSIWQSWKNTATPSRMLAPRDGSRPIQIPLDDQKNLILSWGNELWWGWDNKESSVLSEDKRDKRIFLSTSPPKYDLNISEMTSMCALIH